MSGGPPDPQQPLSLTSDPEDAMDPDPTAAATDPQDDPVTVPAAAAAVLPPTGPALGTLLWGCTALAVAALVGAYEVADVRVDPALVVPVGMVVLGLLLVLGAVVTALRRRA